MREKRRILLKMLVIGVLVSLLVLAACDVPAEEMQQSYIEEVTYGYTNDNDYEYDLYLDEIEYDVDVYAAYEEAEEEPYDYEIIYIYYDNYDDINAEDDQQSLLPENITEAIVTRVIDGDTVELSTGERIRFIGIDAPEIGEPGADEATAFVREHVLNQTIWLEADGNDTDRFGRLRRYVWTNMPTDTEDAEQIQRYQLNALLLMHGLAEVSIIGDVRNADLFHEIAIPLVFANQEQTEQATTDYNFVGNRNSQIFHVLTCRTLPAEHNRIYFETRADALDAGHRACRNCRP